MKYPVASLGDVVRVSESGCHTAAQTDSSTGLWPQVETLEFSVNAYRQMEVFSSFSLWGLKRMTASARKTNLKIDSIGFLKLTLWLVKIPYHEMNTFNLKSK